MARRAFPSRRSGRGVYRTPWFYASVNRRKDYRPATKDNLNREVADSAPASDSVSATVTLARTAADTAAATDALTTVSSLARAVADPAPPVILAPDTLGTVQINGGDGFEIPFTLSASTPFRSVRVWINKNAAVTDPMTVSVMSGSSGSVVSGLTTSLPAASVGNTDGFFPPEATVTFDNGVVLPAGTYWLRFTRGAGSLVYNLGQSAAGSNAFGLSGGVWSDSGLKVALTVNSVTVDTVARALTQPRTAADAAPAADAVTHTVAESRAVADTAAATDANARVLALPRAVVEGSTIFWYERVAAGGSPGVDFGDTALNRGVGIQFVLAASALLSEVSLPLIRFSSTYTNNVVVDVVSSMGGSALGGLTATVAGTAIPTGTTIPVATRFAFATPTVLSAGTYYLRAAADVFDAGKYYSWFSPPSGGGYYSLAGGFVGGATPYAQLAPVHTTDAVARSLVLPRAIPDSAPATDAVTGTSSKSRSVRDTALRQAQDTFDRANGSLGADWTATAGLSIASNAVGNGGATVDSALYNTAFSADQFAEAAFSQPFMGVLVRASGSGATLNGYVAYWSSGSTVQLRAVTGGTLQSPLASASGLTAVRTVRLEAVGTTLTVFVNGVSVTSATDATYSAGSSGFLDFNSSGTLDNFLAGDLTMTDAVTRLLALARAVTDGYLLNRQGSSSGEEFGFATGPAIAVTLSTPAAIDQVDLWLATVGAPTDDVVVEVVSSLAVSGSVVSGMTATIPAASLSGAYQRMSVTLPAVGLPAGTYYVRITRSGALSGVNYYKVRRSSSGSADWFYNGTSWIALTLVDVVIPVATGDGVGTVYTPGAGVFNSTASDTAAAADAVARSAYLTRNLPEFSKLVAPRTRLTTGAPLWTYRVHWSGGTAHFPLTQPPIPGTQYISPLTIFSVTLTHGPVTSHAEYNASDELSGIYITPANYVDALGVWTEFTATSVIAGDYDLVARDSGVNVMGPENWRPNLPAGMTYVDEAPDDAVVRSLSSSRACADTAAATDAVTRAMALSRACADSAPATDAVTRSGPSPQARTTSDTAAATDIDVRSLSQARAPPDSAPAIDTVTRSGPSPQARSVSDSAPATDAVARSLVEARSVADSAPAGDSVARTFAITRSAADTAAATDTVTRSRSSSRACADTAAATDTVARFLSQARSVADSTPAVGVVTGSRSSSRACADSTPATDAVARALAQSRAVADSAPATDAVTGAITLVSTASLSATSSLTASGSSIAVGVAALTGTGTLAATCELTAVAAADLSAAGHMGGSTAGEGTAGEGTAGGGVDALVIALASVALDAAGTMVVSGVSSNAADLTASSDLSASAIVIALTSTSLTASGTLTVSALVLTAGASVLTATGTLTATGARAVPATASLSATTDLVATALQIAQAQAALTATATLTATTSVTALASVSLSALATLLAAPDTTQFGEASLTASGTLTASGVIVKVGTASLSTQGGLAADGARVAVGLASLSGTATLSVSVIVEVVAASSLVGLSSLTAVGALLAQGTADLAALGTVAFGNVYVIPFNMPTVLSPGLIVSQTDRPVVVQENLSGVDTSADRFVNGRP